MRGILNGSIYEKPEDEDQKLRMAGGSWSINLDDLPADASIIQFITELETYTITRHKAFKTGFVRVMQGEHKLIVPLKNWDKDTVAINE